MVIWPIKGKEIFLKRLNEKKEHPNIYQGIPSLRTGPKRSSGSCSENPGTPLRSRYCGAFFNFAKDQLSNGIVCGKFDTFPIHIAHLLFLWYL
eukprot:TCALIF_09001-PA protein Name:"Protein of unknown function" AED:0.19 eAED:0.19 QI:354/0.57/0.75/0.87/0/0/8/76/92